MTKPALEEIIEIEKEIQTKIEAERHNTGKWLADQREIIARESEVRIAAHRQECELMISKAEEEACQELTIQVREAERYETFLEELSNKKLSIYIKKYLPRILPEGQT
jgi:hypothetical protein